MLEAWGRFVYRWRWVTLVVSAVLLGLSVYGLLGGGTLTSGNSGTSNLEAARAQKLINQQLSSGQPAGTSFLLIFGSTTQPATDPAFRAAVESALAPIRNDPRVSGVQTPYAAATPALAQALISKDRHEALVQVNLKHTGTRRPPTTRRSGPRSTPAG
jgi:uncharacterized membrane protein YdfJ with MMPL/SSD domain